MKKKVLITGATGLIGSELVRQCHEMDISVNYLTTSKGKIKNTKNYKGFYWNPEEKEIDVNAFKGVSAIINLVGATISKRWTTEYKQVILESRTKTANLLFEKLKENDHGINHFISASGVGIYPSSKTKLYSEDDNDTDDSFLSEVVVAWEAAADQFLKLGMEVSKVRTGMVLAKNDGALPQIVKPIKFNVGAPLGSGEQWQSWIHIMDIAGIYLFIFNNQFEGTYNAVAPNPVINKKMTKEIAKQLDQHLWLPNIPKFSLKLLLGEMSHLVLDSQLVSSKKIKEVGYRFKYRNIETALENLL